jgi:hypothetical protein
MPQQQEECAWCCNPVPPDRVAFRLRPDNTGPAICRTCAMLAEAEAQAEADFQARVYAVLKDVAKGAA